MLQPGAIPPLTLFQLTPDYMGHDHPLTWATQGSLPIGGKKWGKGDDRHHWHPRTGRPQRGGTDMGEAGAVLWADRHTGRAQA